MPDDVAQPGRRRRSGASRCAGSSATSGSARPQIVAVVARSASSARSWRSSRPCSSARIINGPITDGDKDALALDLLSCWCSPPAASSAMWFGGRVLAVAAQDAMYRLRKEVFEHTQTLSLRFFDRQPIGDLMSRITNDLDSVGQLFDKGLYPAINAVFTLVITTVLMFIVSWQLVDRRRAHRAAVIVLMMQITSRYSGPAFAVLQERTGALNGAAEELITGDRTVKAYRVEALADRQARAAQRGGARTRARRRTSSPSPPCRCRRCCRTSTSRSSRSPAAGWRSAERSTSARSPRSSSSPACSPGRSTSSRRSSTWRCRPAPARPGCSRSSTRSPRSSTAPTPTTSPSVDGHVEMDHVDFSYVPGVPILHDVTLHAQPGQKIGLVGPDRRRQEHDHQRHHPLLRHPVRRHPPRRRQHLRRHAATACASGSGWCCRSRTCSRTR